MILSPVWLKAQEYHLQLLDASTKEVVPYAQVNLKDVTTHAVHRYLVTAEGRLSIPLSSPCRVELQALGYKLYQGKLFPEKGKTDTLYLQQDILNLDAVVVTATRTGKYIKDAPVITRIVTAREIERSGISNVQSLLENALPGIEFQRHGTSNDIDIQGLGGRNILVLIDGERLAGETRGNIDYERINTADIEKVEIVKGASSALYGSQAMGAVVNIITKNHHQKVYVEVSTEQKTRSERNFTNIQANDPHKTLKENLDRGNNSYNVLLGLNLKSWKTKTVLKWKNTDAYTLYDRDSLVKQYLNYDTIIREPLKTKPTGIEGGKLFSVMQKITYQWNEKLKAEANVKYYSRHKYDFYKEDKKHDYFDDQSYALKISYDNLKHTQIVASISSDIYNKYDYKERLDKADLNYKDRFINPKIILTHQRGKHQYLLGAEYLKKTLLTDMFVYGQLIDKNNDTYTIFLQDDFRLNDRISIVGGLRGQYNSSFHAQLTPKLSVMYALPHLRLRANYAMGYRAPGLKELYMNWNHLDMFMIEGNPNLRPETNQYTSLSAEYSGSFFNVSLTVFNNAFKDKINGQWANNQTIYRYANVSRSSLYGCDASAKLQAGRFSFITSYSYVNEKNRKEGIRLSAISPHTANLKIGYTYHASNYQLNANFGVRYLSGKDFFVQDKLVIQQDTITDYYPVRYKGYAICRFAVQQQFFNSISLVMGIENVFDYKAPMVTFNTYTGTRRLFFMKMNVKINKLYNKWIRKKSYHQ